MRVSPVSGQNDRDSMTLSLRLRRPLRSTVTAAFLLSTPLAAAAQDLFPLSDEHKRWLEYDAVYIISDREKDAFERLQSEAEREAFIAAFWSRRDPEPLTPENEFRIEHYERIEYANTMLGRETSVPGWMTDRGRIYIQLGEPDERETFAAVPALYPAELWFYLARDELLLPPIYVLFFREYYAGPFIQFNHVIHQPEELMPAQSFSHPGYPDGVVRIPAGDLRRSSPTQPSRCGRTGAWRRACCSRTWRSSRRRRCSQDINRAPYRRLDTGWVTGAEAGRGLVESEYLFNFVPSAGNRPRPSRTRAGLLVRALRHRDRTPALHAGSRRGRQRVLHPFRGNRGGHDSRGRRRPRLRGDAVSAADREPSFRTWAPGRSPTGACSR